MSRVDRVTRLLYPAVVAFLCGLTLDFWPGLLMALGLPLAVNLVAIAWVANTKGGQP